MADNMVDYFHVLTDDEIDAIEQAYNYAHDDANLNIGILPFMNRKIVLEVIKEYIEMLDEDEDEEDSLSEIGTTLEVLEVILSRVRLEPLNKAKVKKWRKAIRDRLESG